MISLKDNDEEINRELEKGSPVIKVVGAVTYPYLDHLKKHNIRHYKHGQGVVVLVDGRYRNFGGLAGLYEHHFVLEEGEEFNKNTVPSSFKEV